MDLSLLLLFYFGILLFLGFCQRVVGDSAGFILADRKLSFPLLVASLVATFYGASAVVGTAGIANSLGLGVLWFVVPFYLGNLALIKLLPRMEGKNAYTLPDFLGEEFDSKTAVAAAAILGVLCLVPESIIAGGKILALTTPLDLGEGMIVVFLVVVCYTLLGGMKSVIASDFLQLALMLAAIFLLVPFLSGAVLSEGISLTPGFLEATGYLGLSEAACWTILLFFLPITSAPLYQRVFSASPGVDVKKALILSVAIWVMIDLVVVAAGLYSIPYGLSDPDQALFSVADELLPGALKPLFFLGLLSAIFSTADSYLHSGASSLSYDVYRRFSSGKHVVLAARAMVVFLGFLSLAIAFYFQEIIPAMIFLLTVWTSGVLVPTLSALYGLRLGERAAFYSIVSGSLSSLVWNFYPLLDINPLFVGLFISAFFAFALRR